jgi:hypothetical protein
MPGHADASWCTCYQRLLHGSDGQADQAHALSAATGHGPARPREVFACGPTMSGRGRLACASTARAVESGCRAVPWRVPAGPLHNGSSHARSSAEPMQTYTTWWDVIAHPADHFDSDRSGSAEQSDHGFRRASEGEEHHASGREDDDDRHCGQVHRLASLRHGRRRAGVGGTRRRVHRNERIRGLSD